MKKSSKLLSTITFSVLSIFSVNVIAQQATNLDDLLSQLAQGKIAQSKQNQEREAEFNAKNSQQVLLLNQASQQRDQAINLSTQLETKFQDNDVELGNKSDALNNRMGELKELFGVLQQVAGDTRSKFQTSVVSAQIADSSFASCKSVTSELKTSREYRFFDRSNLFIATRYVCLFRYDRVILCEF